VAFRGLSRVPEVQRGEVRTIGVAIPNVVDDGDFALIPQAFDRLHTRIEAKGLIEGQDCLGRNMHRGTEIVIEVVRVWHNGVEAVIASAQLDDYKRFVSYGGSHGIPPLRVRAGRF